MKEEIKNDLLKRALGYLDKAEAFASDQIPAFIQELMHFKFFEHMFNGLTDALIVSIFIFAIGAAVTFALCIMSTESLSRYDDDYDNKKRSIAKTGVTIVILIIPISYIIGLACNSSDFIEAYKARYAPRVYLLEYVRNGVDK